MTIREACSSWVHEFNAIPGSVLEKLMDFDDSVPEITPPSRYDRVVVVFDEHSGESGEIIETNVNNTNGLYKIRLDNGEEIEKYGDDIEVVNKEGWLPMWSTLWTFGDKIDEEWLIGKYCEPHLQEMADLGFRIYDSEDFGIVFGIDAAGFDFYEKYWIPLYKLRGLKWHEKETA